MRPTDEQIKAALTHDELLVRSQALSYFAGGYTTDATVMPMAIEAIERFGWAEAFEFVHPLTALPQTEATMRWLMDRIERIGRSGDAVSRARQTRLAEIMSMADPELLRPYESALRGTPDEYEVRQERISERLKFAATPLDELWQALERFCEASNDQRPFQDVDLSHAERLTEAIARHPGAAERVMAWASLEVDEENAGADGWAEGLGVRMAGLMRLEAAAPIIASKLRIDTDWLREECNEALGRIGADAALEPVASLFPDSSWDCRLYATGALERLRSEAVCGRCLALAETEEDAELKAALVYAVLAQFDTRGLDWYRQVGDDSLKELTKPAVATALLNDETFPGFEDALARAHAEASRHRLWRDDVERPMTLDEVMADEPDRGPMAPPEPIRAEPKPGRNAPCPCGSGKKYKKCCMLTAAGA